MPAGVTSLAEAAALDATASEFIRRAVLAKLREIGGPRALYTACSLSEFRWMRFLAFKRQSIAAPRCRLAERHRPHNSQPQARRARTLAARPLARALGRGGGPRRRGEPGLALPLGEAARAALAKAAPAASADLDQRSHAQDRAAAR